MTNRTIVLTDNRDLTTTTLTLDNHDRLDVDPCDLFMNALANAGMTQQQFDKTIDLLNQLHEDYVDGGMASPDIMNGLGKLLDALRLPGYEFT